MQPTKIINVSLKTTKYQTFLYDGWQIYTTLTYEKSLLKLNEFESDNISCLRLNEFFIAHRHLNGELRVFCQVDYLKTVSIFVLQTQNEILISDHWNTIKEKSNKKTNELHKSILRALAGYTICEHTNYDDIVCLNSNSAYKDGRLIELEYLIFNKKEKEIILSDVRDILVKSVPHRLNYCLLFSGGTDSSCAFGLLKSMNLDFKTLHIYSDYQKNTDLNLARFILKKENFNFENAYFYKSEYIREDLKNEYQRDFTIIPKMEAIDRFNLKESFIITGEIGDQLFGGPKMESLISLMNYKRDHHYITNLWINMSYVNGPKSIEFPKNCSNDAYDCIVKRIKFILPQIEHLSYPVQAACLNFVLKGQYRLYAYKQNYSYNWLHLFADHDFVENVLISKGKEKYNKGIIKYLQKELFPIKSKVSWYLPKNGLGIPTYDKIV